MKKINRKIKKKTVLKILTIVISLAILILVCIEFYPLIKDLTTIEGRINFKNKIGDMGIKGAILLYLIEAVQMIFVILPGEPIEILYGMCYGAIGGAILLTFAVFINTVLVYLLVKKYGKKVLIFFFSKEKVKKLENSKLFKKQESIEYLLILLFFLPGTPKDLLLYIGALLPIDAKKFIIISTFVRLPSVISSTIAGSNIVNGNIKMIIGVYAVTAVILAIVLIIQKLKNKKNKNDDTNDIIKDIMNI